MPAQRVNIHPANPQQRAIAEVSDCLRDGGVIAYPTDSGYALGCMLGNKAGAERIRQIRALDKHHNFTLICADMSQAAAFARIDNSVFRYVKSLIPGPYTFILNGTAQVPKRLMHAKRKTIGIRVPDCRICQDLLGSMEEPIMSVSLVLADGDYGYHGIEEYYDQVANQVDQFVDAGDCQMTPTTVLSLVSGVPELLRQGAGPLPGGI